MKYEGAQPSGKDKDIYIHKFAIGLKEIICLRDILVDARKRTPKTFETTPLRGRLQEIERALNEVAVAAEKRGEKIGRDRFSKKYERMIVD